MDRTATGALLWSRAALVALVATFVGAAGHVTADGLLPGPLPVVLLWMALVVLSARVLERPASALRLTVLVGAGQALVHLVLSASAGHRGVGGDTATVTSSPGLSVPTVDGRRVGSLLDAYAASQGRTSLTSAAAFDPLGEAVAHAPMMAAHLAAAAVVGFWLAQGERALWTVLALAAGALLALLVRPLPLPAPARVRSTTTRRAPVTVRLLARSVVRRGPPALLAG